MTTLGADSAAVIAQSIGGGGGNGGFDVSVAGAGAGTGSGAVGVGLGGRGGGGGEAARVSSEMTGNLMTSGERSGGLLVQSVGGGGGNGGFDVTADISVSGTGGGGAAVGLGGAGEGGGSAGPANSTLDGDVVTRAGSSTGVTVQSVGGGGGNGGVSISGALSFSGTGGGAAAVGFGGAGGNGNAGRDVNSAVVGDVTTLGEESGGVIAQSLGGGGGNGGMNVAGALSITGTGSGAVGVGFGGPGGTGGSAGSVENAVTGDVSTVGEKSSAVVAQSLGAGGGTGGMAIGAGISFGNTGTGAASVGFGSSGGKGGFSESVTNTVTGDVSTGGNDAIAVLAQSVGGGGGTGGVSVGGTVAGARSGAGAVAVAIGGAGGDGGYSGDVENTVLGNVRTLGRGSPGVVTQSLGGGGGNGGVSVAGGISMSTTGSGALSVGVGGAGGGGGEGARATSTFAGGVFTMDHGSPAILTQSLGGGGGNGGVNVTGAVNLSKESGGALGVGVGGLGGDGDNASAVDSTVNATGEGRSITTMGNDSPGVMAQSVGGGGGHGGVNVTGAVNLSGKNGAAIGVGVGGFGGGAGSAAAVRLSTTGDITTFGAESTGLMAQSVGGGGGNGGVNVSGSLEITKPSGSSAVVAASIGVGGFGGLGGRAGNVEVDYEGTIAALPRTLVSPEITDPGTGELIEPAVYEIDETEGSDGLVAQSLGGGGGNGAVNVSSGLSFKGELGAGGSDAHGLLIGVGGFGGTGGSAGNVEVNVDGGNSISAAGDGRSALLASSVGGGGGSGGLNVSGGITSDSPLIVGVGGLGRSGGTGGDVAVAAATDLFVGSSPEDRKNSAGLLAQSIGGAGGDGGLNVSGGITLSKESSVPSITFGIGGFGGSGSISGNVDAIHDGTIAVTGGWTHGIMAQSVAGGGGNGALNVSSQLNFADSESSGGNTDLSIVAGLGGHGGTGADAGNVVIRSSGSISSEGDHARGIVAQSVGGGGGMGGINVTAVGTENSSPIALGVGGFGSGGGDAGSVLVTRGDGDKAAGMIVTNGTSAIGLEASSIGGGGGDAGMNFVVGYSRAGGDPGTGGSEPPSGDGSRPHPSHTGVDDEVFANYDRVLDELERRAPEDAEDGSDSTSGSAFATQIAIGGGGGEAGDGGDSSVDNRGDVLTFDDHSHGILAQSVGGGGGNAALNVSVIRQRGQDNKNKGFNLLVGGAPGDGGDGATVDVNHVGAIETGGRNSYGVLAQSVGGGGGNAALDFADTEAEGGKIGITLGRRGGTGGIGGDVTLISDGSVLTRGSASFGLLAQSIGNGGGNSSSTSVSGSVPESGASPARAAAVTVGFEGGEGGRAGNVTLNAQGFVATEREDSHAIFAQSVGGGGGNGGLAKGPKLKSSGIALALGGRGGEGGEGGDVDVASAAEVTTNARRSIGIFAQSVGGAGGTGGLIEAEGEMNEGSSAVVAIGGDGGTGMTSGSVTISNSGTVLTDGEDSHGILAQSVGGGGGNAGIASNRVKTDDTAEATQIGMTVGGTGGSGAKAGDVEVANSGLVATSQADSIGVFAQSIGGGGGNAALVSSEATSGQGRGAQITLGIGGTGGTGGTGGSVTVSNAADRGIVTLGDNSHGIFAMSIGGGGGTGSTTTSANTSEDDEGSTPMAVAFSLGGSGGSGGTGGDVIADNAGSIATFGLEAHGIFAQSVGGGGGKGGAAVVGNVVIGEGNGPVPSGGPSSVFVGGSGGDGNSAGKVTISNSGTIFIDGNRSYGIYAQSVGGGGGDGGSVIAASSDTIADPLTALASSVHDISVGGAGGDGADGGDVLVDHTGSITSNGDESYGVFAQSIAGGGGRVGTVLTSPAWMAADIIISAIAGGRSGVEGEGGSVVVNTSGDIVMYGANSQAQLQQSVNGGGGDLNLFVDVSETARVAGDTVEIPENTATLSGAITLGGEDADGATGNAVEASHSGKLSTRGESSVASLTQSIGGGGGQANAKFVLNPVSVIDLSLLLGGKNTDNAPGGSVRLWRTGDIETSGARSQGVSVQSIGGGGGRLTTEVTTRSANGPAARGADATASLMLGADPSFFNSGGDLSLDLVGSTRTSGDFAPGLVLQSIGAGGGQTLLTGLTAADVAIGATDGSSGDGGGIAVSNAGNVLTAGVRSDGIVLQSIGGGGGYVRTDLEPAAITLMTNPDNAGDGGDIDFVQTGNVYASGAGSAGIITQSIGGGGGIVDEIFRGSAGGNGRGGAISLETRGNIVADADEGVAVFAQSVGRNGGGPISLGLDGVIKGGSGSGATAIEIDGGTSNRIGLGERGFVFALSDQAIVGGGGNEAVFSKAQVVGNIDLGSGLNSFINGERGVLVTQERVDLGPQGLLTNEGVLSPGGSVANPDFGLSVTRSDLVTSRFVPQTTDVTGSILMTPTSRLLLDASFRTSGAAGDGSDLIRATGTTAIDGAVEPTLLSLERTLPLIVIQSGDAAYDNGADVRDTVVIDYSIVMDDLGPAVSAQVARSVPMSMGSSVSLIAAADFSLPSMTRNQRAVGDHINDILTGEGSASLGPLFAYVGNMTDEDEVIETIDRLTTEGYAANGVEALMAGRGFANALMDCERQMPADLDLPPGDCFWISTEGNRFEQQGFDGFRPLKTDSASFVAGMERAIDSVWTVGFAAGYETINLASGDNFASEGHRGHIGASIERETGALNLSAALTSSFGRYDNERYVGISNLQGPGQPFALGTAESEQTISQTNLRVSAAYTFRGSNERTYATPSVNFDASYIYSRGASESGVGDYGMEIGDTGEWVLAATPSVEIGGRFAMDGGTILQPYFRGGLTVFSKDELYMDSSFIGAPSSAGQFRNYSGFDKIVGRVNAGIVIEKDTSNMRLELGYQGAYSDNSVYHGAAAKLSMRF